MNILILLAKYTHTGQAKTQNITYNINSTVTNYKYKHKTKAKFSLHIEVNKLEFSATVIQVRGWSSYETRLIPPCSTAMITKYLYQGKNVTVVFHSFDVFEFMLKGFLLLHLVILVVEVQFNDISTVDICPCCPTFWTICVIFYPPFDAFVVKLVSAILIETC